MWWLGREEMWWEGEYGTFLMGDVGENGWLGKNEYQWYVIVLGVISDLILTFRCQEFQVCFMSIFVDIATSKNKTCID